MELVNVKLPCGYGIGRASTPRDMKVVGFDRNNMSSRFYDILMFEMTFHV